MQCCLQMMILNARLSPTDVRKDRKPRGTLTFSHFVTQQILVEHLLYNKYYITEQR